MSTVLLHEVPRNSVIEFDGQRFLFEKIDGMYSRCFIDEVVDDDHLVHLSASTPVTIIQPGA